MIAKDVCFVLYLFCLLETAPDVLPHPGAGKPLLSPARPPDPVTAPLPRLHDALLCSLLPKFVPVKLPWAPGARLLRVRLYLGALPSRGDCPLCICNR